MDASDTVLAVIDVQGKLAAMAHDHERLLAVIERTILIAQILGIPIVWTEQAPEKIGSTVEPVSRLLFPLIKPIAKRSFSCYASEEFRQALLKAGRNRVLITGIETHVCVYQTARDLCRHGYKVEVVADAVSSRDKGNTDIALARLRQEGVGITSMELAVCELMGGADHPNFREIMSHIKR